MPETVRAEPVEDGRLLVVRLCRPEKRNALDLVTVEQLLAAIPPRPPRDRRAYLVYGEGTVFSAGADRQTVDAGGRPATELTRGLYRLYRRVCAQPLPIVAWLNGPAIGAGALLSILCDLRFVSETARLEIPVGALGIALAPWLVEILTRELGAPLARRLLLAGGSLDSRSLIASSLAVSEVNTADQAKSAALALAGQRDGVATAHRFALQGRRRLAQSAYESARRRRI